MKQRSLLSKIIYSLLGLSIIALFLILLLAPAKLENSKNRVIAHPSYSISQKAQDLHKTLVIGDWHADSTLWKRDLLERSDRGHVDIPRMREGNAAVQMFTSVTKVPDGINYEKNSTETSDKITLLQIVQLSPIASWSSLTARALYHAHKLQEIQSKAPDQFQLILTSADLTSLLERRAKGESIVGGLLGTEGSHALDGKLENIDTLFNAGFRMMSLHHFFDNKLGGSLHGESAAGLTEFGRQALAKMQAMNIIIDVSHSSEKVVEEVLTLSNKPLVVSHTGLYGYCQSKRNISDKLMIKIAAAGGLIGIGYWDAAVCEATPASIVKAIRYGIELLGVDHIALGSDYDGAIEAPFDISELAILTEEMIKAEFSETEIRKVMGGNMMRFLNENLPIK